MEERKQVHVIPALQFDAFKAHFAVPVEDKTTFHPIPELVQKRVHITRLTLHLFMAIYDDSEW